MIMEEGYSVHADEDVERALGMLNGFLGSQLWNGLHQACRVLAEHPIARETEAGAVARRTIDLLFRVGEGWYLVDYRTDAIGLGEGLEDRLEGRPYADHVRLYASAWKDITEELLSQAGVWLSDINDVALVLTYGNTLCTVKKETTKYLVHVLMIGIFHQ